MDLIDREKVMSTIRNMVELPNEMRVKALAAVSRAKAVDAKPVVHGRWDPQRYYGGMRKGMVARIICSECGYPNEKTNYCPQCGAKMDGVADG